MKASKRCTFSGVHTVGATSPYSGVPHFEHARSPERVPPKNAMEPGRRSASSAAVAMWLHGRPQRVSIHQRGLATSDTR